MSDQKNSPVSRTIGSAIPRITTSVVPARSPPPNGKPSRLRRTQPSRSRKQTTPKPIQHPVITHHQRWAIACSEWLFGSRAFWFPPHPAATSATASVDATSAQARR